MIYVGDTPLISLNTGVALAGAASVSIIFRKPDEVTEGVWVGTINGQLVEYTALTTDLDVGGRGLLHAYVVDLGGWTGHGKVTNMTVNELWT